MVWAERQKVLKFISGFHAQLEVGSRTIILACVYVADLADDHCTV
jgi:hypothetical protein